MTRVVALLLLLSVPVLAEPNRGPFRKIAVLRLRDDSTESIDPSVKKSVLRRLEEIRDWGADCVILDIESYGGLVTASIETGDEILALGRDIHTIAYIHRRAISGAAMLSLACQEIVMSEEATIGDSQAIYMTPGGMAVAPEKMQTTVAATFRKYGERNGYPVPLLEAMVRQEIEVVRYRKPLDPDDPGKGFGYEYFRSDSLPTRAEAEVRFLTDQEVVVRENELATLTARDALKYGVCSRIEPELSGLVASIKAPGGAEMHFEWTWAELTSRWLLGAKALLFLVGAVAGYIAFKTPGTGVPELVALVAFGLFFGASAISGFTSALEPILFFAGVLLMMVEIFVLPGFGVAGFLGLGLIFLSLGLAAVPVGDRDLAAEPTVYLWEMAKQFLWGALGATILMFFIARHLPKVPLFRGLALASPGADSPMSSASGAPLPAGAPAVGAEGVAESTLRPAGRACIDGRQLDVVAEGDYVNPGAAVRVVEVRGNVVVVRAKQQAS